MSQSTKRPFHLHEFDFPNHGEQHHQVEHFFAARTTETSIDGHRWTEVERKAITGSRGCGAAFGK